MGARGTASYGDGNSRAVDVDRQAECPHCRVEAAELLLAAAARLLSRRTAGQDANEVAAQIDGFLLGAPQEGE